MSTAILIVEDNDAQRRTLSDLVSDEGFDPMTCATAGEALEIIRAKEIGVMIVDHRLPDMSGTELLECVRATHPIPVIIHTAYGSLDSAKEAVNLGAFAYVEKVSELEELMKYVHRAARDQMTQHRDQLRSLMSQLMRRDQQDRRVLAADLHDHLAQFLAICQIKVHLLKKMIGAPEQGKLLDEISQLLKKSDNYTRSIMSRLSPHVLYKLGINSAVETLVKEMANEHGLKVVFHEEGQPCRASDDEALFVFQTMRELLLNIVKHAQVDRVSAVLRYTGHDITLVVTDEGRGFAPLQGLRGAPHGQFGLFNIRERAEMLGGSLQIDSARGEGCRVTATIPIHATQPPPRSSSSDSPEARRTVGIGLNLKGKRS